jgi:LPXTG-motif cell wall-anchored protein
MMSVMLNLQDQAGSEGGGVPVSAFVVLAVLVVIAAGYFLLRKRK